MKASDRESTPLLLRTLPHFSGIYFFKNLGPFRPLLFLLVVCSIFTTLFRFGTVALLGQIVTRAPSLTSQELFSYYLPMWIGCLLAAEGLHYITRRWGEALPPHYAELQLARFHQALLLAPGFRLASANRERLATLLGRYTGHLEKFVYSFVWTMVGRGTQFAIIIALLAYQDWRIAVLFSVYLTFFLLIALKISARITPYVQQHAKASAETSAVAAELLLRFPFIKQVHAYSFQQRMMDRVVTHSRDTIRTLKRFHALRWFLQLNLFNVLTTATLVYATYQVIH